MQMHECITGYAQIIYACCWVIQSQFHPLRAGQLGYGARRIYRGTLIHKQDFQPSHQDSYDTKFNKSSVP
jgi:hypothetical protein